MRDDETPLTDALIKQHSEEHEYLDSRDEWSHADAVRQARDLIDHARRLERDRARAVATVRFMLADIENAVNMSALYNGHEHSFAQSVEKARALLHSLGEGK